MTGSPCSDCRPTRSVICVTPSHQFPLGTTMIHPTADGLLEFAQAHGAVIIEDDYDGEFRLGARPLDALQTLDRSESVFYVGTFSKSLFPEMRLGFVVPPPWARPALVAAKQCTDWHCAVLEQETLAAFIAEGHLARHVRKMRQVYGARSPNAARLPEARFSPLAGADSLCRWIAPGGAFENVARRRRTGGPGSTRGHRNLFVAGILFRQDRPARIGVRLRRNRRARYRRRLVARSTSVAAIGGRQVKVTLPWRR